MITSKDVFSKRKEGLTIEAYNMAVELVSNTPYDEWNDKAYAYCLIDMIKQSISEDDLNSAKGYSETLSNIEVGDDEILSKNVQRALDLSDPKKEIISDAKSLSKQGKHYEAVNAYKTALVDFPNDQELKTSLAWELYRVGKELFSVENINVLAAKRLLADYLKLNTERPSLLHSLFLRFADKLVGNENFSLVSFLKLWDLNNLTKEDYEPYKADSGKIFPSSAERLIQHAAKDALNKSIVSDIDYILPFIDRAIINFSDNFWLVYYKAKLLHSIGRNDEALEFSISVVKNKINDYWAWDLLGEILLASNPDKSLSCYCKALLCKSEDKFLANVRVKFVDLLTAKSLFNEAAYEVNKAVESREKEGWKATNELNNFQNSEWYKSSTATKNNYSYYKQNTTLADELLFDNMPWLDAIVGEVFTIPNKPNKPKRKLYISLQGQANPLEIAVPNNKYDFKSLTVGQGLQVKGECDHDQRFQVYLIESRDTNKDWDIFPDYTGIIDYINVEKRMAHFMVNKDINGTFLLSDFSAQIADTVILKVSSYKNNYGTQYSVLTCKKSEKRLDDGIVKIFNSSVRVSNGLGFTEDNIFLDRPMVERAAIESGDVVSGIAVQNYNKKRESWGWKAIQLNL